MSRVRPLILTAVMALALAGCSSEEPAGASASEESGGDSTRTVTTDQGDVAVPADPERIVVLNSALAGFLFALDVPVHATIPPVPGPGGGDYEENWAADAEDDGTVILPWPEEGFDLESIAAEAPDLIVGGGQGFPAFQATEAYEQLSEIAPTVVVSNTLLTWQDQLSFLAGEVFDATGAEADLVAAYDAKVEEVSDAITLPPTPVGYLVMTADLRPFSLPENSALPQALADLGFEPAPVIADNPGFETFGTGDSFEVSPELVGQVFTAPTIFTFGFNGDYTDAATLAQDPIYGQLPAFVSGNAYDLPYWGYRADYQEALELLDVIEAEFS